MPTVHPLHFELGYLVSPPVFPLQTSMTFSIRTHYEVINDYPKICDPNNEDWHNFIVIPGPGTRGLSLIVTKRGHSKYPRTLNLSLYQSPGSEGKLRNCRNEAWGRAGEFLGFPDRVITSHECHAADNTPHLGPHLTHKVRDLRIATRFYVITHNAGVAEFTDNILARNWNWHVTFLWR